MAEAPSTIFGYNDLPLPYYARDDLAFINVTKLAGVQAGPPTQIKVSGQFVQIPLSIRFQFVTNATVASRLVGVSLQDPDAVIAVTTGAAVAQAASLSTTYNFAFEITSAYALGTAFQNGPLPPMVMQSGWAINITATNVQAGDQISDIIVAAIRYPTGPERLAAQLPRPLDLAGIGVL